MTIAPKMEDLRQALLDEAYMAAALSLGRRHMGRTAPNPSVGALLVKDGAVIARGFTAPTGRPHAEAVALGAAGEAARGATLYVTLEPCSHHGGTAPCADAIIAAGVKRVVSALEDPDPRVSGGGHARLWEAGVAVTTGVGASEARRDHLGHILRITQGRPMITLKLAQTADGFAAGCAHDPRLFITGPVADAYTHVQRALHGAILVGAGAARADDPMLTVRLPGMEDCKPLRVALDTHLSLPRRSRLAATSADAPALVIAGESLSEAAADDFTAATGIEVACVALDPSGRVSLCAALGVLAGRGVTRVFCEGGPRLAESLILNGLADETILLTGLEPLGRPGLDALSPAARARLADPAFYRLAESAALGADRLSRYERVA